jgi:multidrug efflux pump subunit AcrB
MSTNDNNMEPAKEHKGEILKEFGMSSWSINNGTTVFVLSAIILISGLISYLQVPKESFPEVIVPEIYVGTAYPGNAPENIEKLITRPLEKEINSITGVDKITSTSSQGYSSIQVKFDFKVNPSEALRKVKDKVDVAMSDPDFPTDLPADPNIFEMNFSELMPVMNINLSGDYSLEELKEFAEKLEDEIEDLPEISKVDIRGVMDKEVNIQVDQFKLESMSLGIGDIAAAIQQENMSVSGGDIRIDNFRRSVSVEGEFISMDDISNIIIKNEKDNIVYLRDVATVSFKEKEKESYAREYLKPVVSLDIIKRAGENLIAASEKINALVAAAKTNYLPANLSLSITNDQSDKTRTQVEELQNSIIFGMLLVVGILLFFMGLRNALFVGVAIPMSMFMSFMILNAMGITFNVMVLFSLVMALGMLVDNGIVVVENIYRLMNEGMDAKSASKYGIGEVAWPIISSTATTLAAFAPLALWPGMMGEFMKYLPLTLIIVLGSSLFVALVINPVLSSVFMKIDDNLPNKRKALRKAIIISGIGTLFLLLGPFWLGNLLIIGGLFILLNTYMLAPAANRFQANFLPRLENAYERFLKFYLQGKRPGWLFASMFGVLIFSFILMGIFPPKVLFFPNNEPQYLNVFLEMPIGTDIESTNDVAKDVERIISETLNDDKYKVINPATGEPEPFLVSSIIGQVGNGTSDPQQGPSFANTPHKARITVSFVEFQDRNGVKTNDVLNLLRERLKDYPDAEIVVSKNEDGPPQGAPINLELRGDNYDALLAFAESTRSFINDQRIPGIEELKIDVNKQKPEMPIRIDREKARRLGLSTYSVGDAIRSGLFGKEVSRYKEGEDDYPINIRFKEDQRFNEETLLNQKISFRDQSTGRIKQVPISAVAEIDRTQTFNAIKRKDLKRVITISSNVLEGYNANEVVSAIKTSLLQLPKTEGVEWAFTGQQEEQAKEMSFLSNALLIAIFLIFLIIVAQFNSASNPAIIMFSVIFSLSGVFLGLVIFRMEFVIIMTMIGIISLAGVVVNNAIVLIDYTILLRARKMQGLNIPEGGHLPFSEVAEAVVIAGKTRLRPVLLTAITTVLGLLPLAVGLNIDFIAFLNEYDPKIYLGGDNNIFWKPMSWAIIFGLTFATFLTLVVVPVMYLLLNRFKYRFIYRVK